MKAVTLGEIMLRLTPVGHKQLVQAEALEADYVWREKTILWMSGLPYGQEGLVEFLNGMTAEYVKAFAISIMVYSPLKYTVHWFDDTRTDVTMDSSITDYRYTADYFNGHHMVEKKTRRRKT